MMPRYWVTRKTFAFSFCALLVLKFAPWLYDAEFKTATMYSSKFPHPIEDRSEDTQRDNLSKSHSSWTEGHADDIDLATNKTAEKILQGMSSAIWPKELLFSILRGNVMAMKENNQTSDVHSACVAEPLLECHNVGFGALLLQTMEQLAYCHHTLASTPNVMWRNCHAVCSKNPHFNSWNWYFEPVNPTVELIARKVVCVAMVSTEAVGHVWLDASFRDRGLTEYDANALITSKTRRAANNIIRRYVKPNKNVTAVVEELYINHLYGNNLLGVHVRGTDHTSESKDHKLPPIKMWLEEARLILTSIPAPSKIFIAGDNSEVLEAFREEFGKNKVFFTRALRAKSYRQEEAPHDYAGRANIDPQRFGSEVLIDILLLAKCHHFLHAESSVATLASFFNPKMKSYFLGELSSKESGITQSQESENDAEMSSPDVSTDSPDDSREQSREVDELREYFVEDRECFIKNSPASSCPNMAAGKFILQSEVKRIFLDTRKLIV